MGTILFDKIVFGPIKSRRLGNSLGINLLPLKGKLCSFDCVYCECGFNKDGKSDKKIPSLEEVICEIKTTFNNLSAQNQPIDNITFSGNGEPTMHPQFAQIIDYCIELRNKLFPQAKIAVLSNASNIHKQDIFNALQKIDNPILKIDSSDLSIINLIDKPQYPYSLNDTIQNLKKFKGNFILQTMFLKGEIDGQIIDNTNTDDVEAWYKIVEELNPRQIMIYTIDRETPLNTLTKVSIEELNSIAKPLLEKKYSVNISG